MAGAFIVVEGPDGAGKTTLVQALARRLAADGRPVTAVRDPGGTPTAEAVRAVLLDGDHPVAPAAELFLYLAARADLVANLIRPRLAAGHVVVSDRFQLSTEAYQAVGRGLPRDAVLAANRLATGGLEPDLTLVLDLPADAGLERQAASGKAPDRLEREHADWHARVATVFREAAGPGVVHLDATRPADEVADAAVRALRERLGETFAGRSG